MKVLIISLLIVIFPNTSKAQRGKAANDQNNKKILACAAQVDTFLKSWKGKDGKIRGKNSAGDCFLRFTLPSKLSDKRFLLDLNSNEPGRKHVANLEMQTSEGFWVYPGIVAKLKKCDVSKTKLQVKINYHLPKFMGGNRLPPFMDHIDRQEVKIQKNAQGEISSIQMKNTADKTVDSCQFL